MVYPSSDGVYILLHEYLVHWRANSLTQDYVIGININLSIGDNTGISLMLVRNTRGPRTDPCMDGAAWAISHSVLHGHRTRPADKLSEMARAIDRYSFVCHTTD